MPMPHPNNGNMNHGKEPEPLVNNHIKKMSKLTIM